MATFWVRKTGNDGNAGTSSGAAKLTIAAGAALLSGGDTLIIGDGVYVEALRNAIPSGSAGAPTIVRAENPKGAILRPTGGYYTIAFTGTGTVQYITIDGLVADNQNANSNPIYCSKDPVGSAHHIIFQNGESLNSTDDGSHSGLAGLQIGQHGNAANHHDNQVLNWESHSNLTYGIYLSGSHDNILDGVYVHDNVGSGIVMFTTGNSGVDNNILRNSRIYDNMSSAATSAGGVLIASGDGNLVYNCQIAGNGPAGSAGHGVYVDSFASNTGIYFNTIVSNSDTAVVIRAAASNSGTIIKDNIFWSNGSDSISDGGSGTVNNNNHNTSDPTFVNEATRDYNLQASSDARGDGVAIVGITTDAVGRIRTDPPDAGALQYLAAVPPGSGTPPIENFDSYSVADALDGKTGGSLWEAAWDDFGADAITIQTAPAGGQGGKAARLVCTTACDAQREFEELSDGIFYFQLRATTAAPTGTMGIFLRTIAESSTMGLRLGPSGAIQVYDDAAGWSSIGSYSADTSVQFALELNSATNPGEYRVQIDGGTFSSWHTAIGSFTAVAFFEIYNSSAGHTLWIDAIGVAPSAPVVDSISKSILMKILKNEEFAFGIPLVSIHTGSPGVTGANEVTGGSYSRKSSIGWGAASGGVIQNGFEISWTSGFPLVTVTHVGLWSSDGVTFITGQSLDLAKTVTSGKVRFAPGALRFSVSNNFSTYLANKLLDYIMSTVDFVTAPVYGAIHTGTLDTAGGGEVTGGSYARQQLQIADWADDGTLSLGDTLYTLLYEAAESWSSVPSLQTGRIGLWDAATSGNFLMWGPDITLPGTTVTAAANSISATITQTP